MQTNADRNTDTTQIFFGGGLHMYIRTDLQRAMAKGREGSHVTCQHITCQLSVQFNAVEPSSKL